MSSTGWPELEHRIQGLRQVTSPGCREDPQETLEATSGGRAQLCPLREGKQGRGCPRARAVLQAHLRKFLPWLSCVMGKIMFLPCVFSSNRRCSSPTLQPCPCSRSSHGLTAGPTASPGRSHPPGERNQDADPSIQGHSQINQSAYAGPPPHGAGHSAMIKLATPLVDSVLRCWHNIGNVLNAPTLFSLTQNNF